MDWVFQFELRHIFNNLNYMHVKLIGCNANQNRALLIYDDAI